MKLAHIYFLSLCTLLQWQVFAEESVLEKQLKLYEEPYISHKYRRGVHLIYDCKKRHFLCVNAKGFLDCKKERETALEDKLPNLRCAPLKQFTSQKACGKSAYEQIHSIKTKAFCVGKASIKIN
jgi:hypothetical protein